MQTGEIPRRLIYLDTYFIDMTEVSIGRYRVCVHAGFCTPPVNPNVNYDYEGRELWPVNGVSWEQAGQFCAFEGKRLPTEAEWEKAARGTDGRKYPWADSDNNNEDCTLANLADIDGKPCVGEMTLVTDYPQGASPYGALNMTGNVAEYVTDWYDEYYYQEDYAGPDYSPDKNPQGPEYGSTRIMRGADWMGKIFYGRSAFRNVLRSPGGGNGFRCVQSNRP
jgi:formylglycine-generating enzyme required for sulfatase activity